MDREKFLEFVRSVDNPELRKEPGMVTQVWQDGEITSQKSGELLWQRSLHCVEWAITGAKELGLEFPHRFGENSFAWVTDDDAASVRTGIRDLIKAMLELIK